MSLFVLDTDTLQLYQCHFAFVFVRSDGQIDRLS